MSLTGLSTCLQQYLTSPPFIQRSISLASIPKARHWEATTCSEKPIHSEVIMDAGVGRTVTQSLSIFKGNFVSGTKVKDLDGESSLDYASEPSLIT